MGDRGSLPKRNDIREPNRKRTPKKPMNTPAKSTNSKPFKGLQPQSQTESKELTKSPNREKKSNASEDPEPFRTPASSRKRKKSSEEGVREFLLHSERNANYEKALAERDESYAELYAKYSKLKDLSDRNQAQVFEEFRSSADASEKKATAIILAQKKELAKRDAKIAQLSTELADLQNTHLQMKKDVAKFEKQVAEYSATSTKLREELNTVQQQLKQSQQIETTYRLFTAMQVKYVKQDTFRCRIVAHNPFRVIEFNLEAKEDRIIYKPFRVSLKNQYPGYLANTIAFEPCQTPMFMRNLIAATYTDVNNEDSFASSAIDETC